MTILNIAAVQNALKEFYLEGLRYQLNEASSVFLAQLERDATSVEGKNIVMALRYGRVGGVGNRADDGELPIPNSRQTLAAKWETKNIFCRFQITDKTVQASRSNVGAFANLLENEISDCETDVKQDLSRQCLGNGVGILTGITGTKTGNIVPVTTAMYLVEGMRIDIWRPGTSSWVNQSIIVDAVSDADGANTVTLPTSGAVASGDQIFIAGNRNLELTGLSAVFENASIYGIDRTLFPVTNARRVNVAGQISEIRIQTAIDDADRRAGAKTNFLMCSFGVRRAYQNLLTAQKQIVNRLDLKGGWKALDYNGIPLAADKYVPPGRMYCLDLKDWRLYHMGDFDWLDKDGAMLSRVPNRAAWEATLVRYADIGCSKPRGQVELFGITEH